MEYAVNDDYAVIAMVASGLGISILPELVLRRTPYEVVVKPLDPPQFREPVSYIHLDVYKRQG